MRQVDRSGQPWAQDLNDLLDEIKHAVDTAREQGMPILSALGQAFAGTPPLPATLSPRGAG